MQHAGFCYFIQTIIESPTKSQMLNFKAASCSQEGANTCWRCRWCQHPSLDCSRNWWRRRTGKGRAVDFHDEQTKIDSFFFLVQKYIGEILFFSQESTRGSYWKSICFLYPLYRHQSCGGGAGAYPSYHLARGRVHPEQLASPNDTNNHAHSLLGSVYSHKWHVLDCGKKPVHLEKTHMCTGWGHKLHTRPPCSLKCLNSGEKSKLLST